MTGKLLVPGLLVAAAAAVADPVTDAEDAAALLLKAAEALTAAAAADDRVAALTDTVRAYEAGLAALRDGIRGATLREREIEAALASGEERLSALLGALMLLESSDGPAALLHPDGPAPSARAAMILAEVSPAVETRTRALRGRLDELAILRTLQDNAEITLERALDEVQEARGDLTRALAERRQPPGASATDIATMQALVNSADTLDGFAATLATLDVGDPAGAAFRARKGGLALPVSGTLLTGFGETDARGRTRPGLTIATAPGALVTAPHAGTVRYAGTLLDLGRVVILEPGPRALLILAGLGESLAGQGDIVSEGAPLGLMGGEIPDADQILIETSAGRGQDRPETLYMELRLDQVPVDPADWFGLSGSTGR